MFDIIYPADNPVVAGLEKHEIVWGGPAYNPLRTITSNNAERKVLSRWSPTPEQRAAIAGGADLYLELMTFGNPLQPIRLAVGMDVDKDFIAEQFSLPA